MLTVTDRVCKGFNSRTRVGATNAWATSIDGYFSFNSRTRVGATISPG